MGFQMLNAQGRPVVGSTNPGSWHLMQQSSFVQGLDDFGPLVQLFAPCPEPTLVTRVAASGQQWWAGGIRNYASGVEMGAHRAIPAGIVHSAGIVAFEPVAGLKRGRRRHRIRYTHTGAVACRIRYGRQCFAAFDRNRQGRGCNEDAKEDLLRSAHVAG